MSAIPPGFEMLEPFGQFHELCGPFHAKKTEQGFSIGLLVQDKHGNKGSNLHGGMLAMLVDTAFTYSSRHSRNPPAPSVTVSLSMEMMGPAKPGEWLEARVEPVRVGRTTTFLNCFVFKGEERIARASAVFQVVVRNPTPPAA